MLSAPFLFFFYTFIKVKQPNGFIFAWSDFLPYNTVMGTALFGFTKHDK